MALETLTEKEIDDLKYALHKRCWTSGNLNERAVREYAKFVLENCTKDFINPEDIRYARVYLNMLGRRK